MIKRNINAHLLQDRISLSLGFIGMRIKLNLELEKDE